MREIVLEPRHFKSNEFTFADFGARQATFLYGNFKGAIPSVNNLPKRPFGLILVMKQPIDKDSLRHRIHSLQDAGAEWFCGAGEDGKFLEEIWDSEATDKHESSKRDAGVSISKKDLQEAIEAFLLIGFDNSSKMLRNCVVLEQMDRKG